MKTHEKVNILLSNANFPIGYERMRLLFYGRSISVLAPFEKIGAVEFGDDKKWHVNKVKLLEIKEHPDFKKFSIRTLIKEFNQAIQDKL